MMMLLMIPLLFGIFLQIYYNKNRKKIVYLTFPSLDYFVVFHAAVGEEFIFRILPHLVFASNFEMRLIISSIIFGLLHAIPLIGSNQVSRDEIILTIVNATNIGLSLIMIEKLFSSPIHWYVSCCIVHALNNIICIKNKNKNIVYNPGSCSGFVTRM